MTATCPAYKIKRAYIKKQGFKFHYVNKYSKPAQPACSTLNVREQLVIETSTQM